MCMHELFETKSAMKTKVISSKRDGREQSWRGVSSDVGLLNEVGGKVNSFAKLRTPVVFMQAVS